MCAIDTMVDALVDRLRCGELRHTRLEDGSGVIVDLEGMQVLSLNATGLFLIERMASGVRHVDRLVGEMVAKFDVSEARAQGDVEQFIRNLATLSGGAGNNGDRPG